MAVMLLVGNVFGKSFGGAGLTPLRRPSGRTQDFCRLQQRPLLLRYVSFHVASKDRAMGEDLWMPPEGRFPCSNPTVTLSKSYLPHTKPASLGMRWERCTTEMHKSRCLKPAPFSLCLSRSVYVFLLALFSYLYRIRSQETYERFLFGIQALELFAFESTRY